MAHIPAIVRLTNHLQYSVFSALILFFNGFHSNFLNAFFMRPEPQDLQICFALMLTNPIKIINVFFFELLKGVINLNVLEI